MAWADEQVLRQPLDRGDHLGRNHHPADAPAGHREIFREAVDHDHVIGDLQRRHRARAVFDAVIDLVGDEGRAEALAFLHQRGHRGAVEHGSGRVRRACGEHAVEPPGPPRVGQQPRVGLKPRARVGGQAHRLKVQRPENVAIRRIAGVGDRHPRARVEQREKRQQEGAGGPGGDRDPLRRDAQPVALGVAAGDAFAQGRQAQRHGVAERPGVHRGARGLDGAARRRGSGLADLHVDDVGARRLPRARRLHHRHDNERIDRATG